MPGRTSFSPRQAECDGYRCSHLVADGPYPVEDAVGGKAAAADDVGQRVRAGLMRHDQIDVAPAQPGLGEQPVEKAG